MSSEIAVFYKIFYAKVSEKKRGSIYEAVFGVKCELAVDVIEI